MKDENYTKNTEPDAADMFHISPEAWIAVSQQKQN
jgi:hypothetical protein